LKGEKYMKKTAKQLLCVILALVLALPLNLLPGAMAVAAENVTERLNPEITQETATNHFTYTYPSDGKKWTVNAGSEAYVDLGAANANANEYYYEISFYGNAISVFAIKGPAHGIVKYTVDGKNEKTVDLYNASRTGAQSVYSVTNLEEKEHTLRAVTQTTKTGSSIVNQISYAEITHQPYVATDVTLSQTSMELYEGQKQKISYVMVPTGSSDENLKFSSNAENIAVVSGNGIVTAKAEGTAEITVSGVGTDKKVTVTVKKGIPALGGTIMDIDTQHTQDTYDEVKRQNITTGTLTAWKNDKAASELVLYSGNGLLSNIQVTADDFQKADGSAKISADHITATFIKSTKAYNGAFLGYGSTTRQVPEATAENRSESSDILYQEGGAVSMEANSVQPVWVEVSVPKDTPAGLYTGRVIVTAEEIDTPLVFTYKVVVQDMTLSDTSEFTYDIGLWQYPYSSAEYYGVEPFSPEHLEILRSLMELYKEAGGNMITATIIEDAWSGQTYSKNEIHYPSMVKWTKQSDGSFTYDYSDFDAWVSLCKEIGIADKVVIYSIAPWHSSFTYWEGGTMKKVGYNTKSDEYKNVWNHFLTDFSNHLDEKGWFDSCYLAIDERNFGQAPDAFSIIEKIKNKDGKSLKTAGDMDSITDASKKEIAKKISLLSVGDNSAQAHAAEFAEILAERKAAGLVTTLYSCTEHKPGNFSLSAPVESYWSAVNAGKAGTAGFRRWAYDAWVEDPLNDATHNAFEPGDCFLVYPSEKNASEKTAKRSVRLERMAEGVRDVNKLRILAEKDTSLTADVQAVYDKITTTASTVTGGQYLTDAEVASLASQMNSFKAGVAAVTEKYLASQKDIVLGETSKTLNVGESWQIAAGTGNLVFRSADPAVASVDAGGKVTANKKGSTVITMENKDMGYTGSVQVTVAKTLKLYNTLTDYKLPEEYLSDIDKDEKNEKGRIYLGQPDMVMLNDNKTLITVYPKGHGHGPLIMKVSEDAGETWTEKMDTPADWQNSLETPTMYKLNMTDGSTKLIMITGRPDWSGTNKIGGWDTSISDDEGKSWSPYERFHEKLSNGNDNFTVVAMASLIQLKNEKGEYIDKWMGVYHDGASFVNYKTYLTFDKDGNQQWTAPEPYLSKYRSIEFGHQICEVGLFRSPDGKRIVGLARSQSHNNPSTMFYSDDEGETWSKPVDIPGSLAGERHKAMYDPTDPTGQRMIITFREICYDLNKNDQMDGYSDWLAGDWIGWVGTYDQLMNLDDGQFRILLCEDWAANEKSGDTGYTGLVVQPDGTYIMDTYGHWDKEYSQSYKPYNVKTDLCWIKQAKFKLSDLDSQVIGTVKSSLETEVQNTVFGDASQYTEKSWNAYQEALTKAQAVLANSSSTQLDYYGAIQALKETRIALRSSDTVEIEDITEIKKELDDVLTQSGDYTDGKKYTPTSWQAFQEALKEAQAVQENIFSTKEEIQAALKKLVEAMEGLKLTDAAKPDPKPNPDTEKPNTDKPDQPAPRPTPGVTIKEGETYDDGTYAYKVTSVAKKTAEVVGIKKKNITKITVFSSVKLGNEDYKITSIAASAFKNNKKVKSAVIRSNVESIGNNAFAGCTGLKSVSINSTKLKKIGSKAFYNCKKLKSIRIKSKVLAKVGKNAFKGISKKAVIKVPKAKYKKYVKVLAKKGQSKTVKIKK